MSGTVVLGYDESPSANAALVETIRVAKEREAAVVVVFGFYISPWGGTGEGSIREAVMKVGQHAVNRAVADLEAAGVAVSSRLVEGKPADALIAVAAEMGADMIVVGTVGENPIAGALLGSVGAAPRATVDGAAPRRPGARQVTFDLQQAARDHLWLHFTRMGAYRDGEVPIIVRGDGCYLEDSSGKRYLDALAGLFCVNVGYSYGEEMGQAALEQMRELPFYTNWSYAHPRAVELAAEVASLAPGDLNRLFFVSGGSEAVESAWKLARQYYLARGGKRVDTGGFEAEMLHDQHLASPPARKYKAIARRIAYHGTTLGALSINGIPAIRMPFEPLVPEVRHVSNTGRYHRPPAETEEEFTAFLLAELETTIEAMGPESVCLVHMEPVQNGGGCFTPPTGYWRGVRELCDRYDILLSADEVITGFGRLGHWFALGALRHPAGHRLLREGALVGVRVDRRGDRDRPRDGAVPRGHVHVLARDHVRRPPGRLRGRAEEHRDHEARRHRRGGAASTRTRSARRSPSCSTCRSSATCAAPASSTRSSSSRTRRRARRSPTRSARRSCAGS